MRKVKCTCKFVRRKYSNFGGTLFENHLLFSRLGIVFVFNIFGLAFCMRSMQHRTKHKLYMQQILWFHMPRQQPLSITWRSELNLMSICSTWPFSEITKPERETRHTILKHELFSGHFTLVYIQSWLGMIHVAEYWMLLLQWCLCALLLLFDVVRSSYCISFFGRTATPSMVWQSFPNALRCVYVCCAACASVSMWSQEPNARNQMLQNIIYTWDPTVSCWAAVCANVLCILLCIYLVFCCSGSVRHS